MSGAVINRNLCAKHIPVVVNAINRLEKQIASNSAKELIFEADFTNAVVKYNNLNKALSDKYVPYNSSNFDTEFDASGISKTLTHGYGTVLSITPLQSNTDTQGQEYQAAIAFSLEYNSEPLSDDILNELHVIGNTKYIRYLEVMVDGIVRRCYPTLIGDDELGFFFRSADGYFNNSSNDIKLYGIHTNITETGNSTIPRKSVYVYQTSATLNTYSSANNEPGHIVRYNLFGKKVTFRLVYED